MDTIRLALGTIPSGYQNLPRFLIRTDPPKRAERVFILGRLYVGYVGLIWITDLFELDIWIYKPKGLT